MSENLVPRLDAAYNLAEDALDDGWVLYRQGEAAPIYAFPFSSVRWVRIDGQQEEGYNVEVGFSGGDTVDLKLDLERLGALLRELRSDRGQHGEDA